MALTWRNVDTPNFSGSFDGLRLANQALSGAASGLSDALGKFGDYQQSQADNAVALAASKIQDPNQLRAALADGSLVQGVDPSRVTAGTLANVNSQVGNLLSQKASQLSLDKGTYDFDRTKTNDTNVDAARPLTSQLLALSAQGKTNEANALLSSAEGQAAISKLSPAQQDALVRDMQGAQGTATSNAQSGWNLGISQRNDGESRAVSAALAQIQDLSLGDPSRSRAALESFRNQMSPAAFAQLQGAAERAVPGTVATLDSLATQYQNNGGMDLSPPGTAGTASGSAWDRAYKNTATGAPITSMSLGDITKDGGVSDQLMKATGNSPIGMFGINKGTIQQYAPKVFGADANSVQFTPQNQDKLAKAIFDDRKANGTMTKTWPTLAGVPGADTPGGMKNVTWEQVRDHIGAKEASGSPMDIRQGLINSGNQQVTQQLTTASRNAEDLANTVDPKRYATATSNTGAKSPDVAAQLSKDEGSGLSGTDPKWIANRIDEIRQQSGNTLNAAQAGEILRTSLKGGGEHWWQSATAGLFDPTNSYTKNGMQIDKDQVSALVGRAGRGELVSQAVQSGILDQGTQTVAQSQALAANMQKRYMGMLQAQQMGRASAADVAQAKAQFDKANAMYQVAMRGQGSNAEAVPADWQKNRQEAVTADNKATAQRATQAQAVDDYLKNPWLNTGL